jgi:diphthamide synthase subunit DPH2
VEIKEASLKNLKPFVKGDPRINKTGRPKKFDELRKIAQAIAEEAVEVKIGSQSFQMERREAILRQWASSTDKNKQENFMMVAYGKVPDELTITPQSRVTLLVKYVGSTNGKNGNGSGSPGGASPG